MLTRITRYLQQAETWLLAVLLLGMILLACAQILLRNVSTGSLLWADPLGRMMLLWLAMLGAITAAQNKRHLAIDLVGHYLPDAVIRGLDRLVSLVTAVMCGILAWHTGRFVLSEMDYPSELVLGIPNWLAPAIIPFTFALIGLRYLIHSVSPASVETDA